MWLPRFWRHRVRDPGAQEALNLTCSEIERTYLLSDEAREVGERLRAHRKSNGFAEMVAELYLSRERDR